MSVANNSYIDSSSGYVELFNFLDKLHIYELLAQQESEVNTDISTSLSSAQADRLNQSLNWGRSLIDTGLRELYVVDGLTYADAPDIIKDLNARLAQNFLERRRLRSGEAPSDDIRDLRLEIEVLAKESSSYSLTFARKGGIASATESKATQFDNAGQFDNIIPQSDDSEIWPDLANQP